MLSPNSMYNDFDLCNTIQGRNASLIDDDINTNPLVNTQNKTIWATIAPNPAKEFIYISSYLTEGVTLALYNMQGVLVMKQVINKNIERIDISALPNGLYIYTLNSPMHNKLQGKLNILR
jgi:hypothetical protein